MKRQRTQAAPARRAKRPIDKKLTNVQITNLIAGKQTVDLYAAATFPGTITGLRWSLSVVRSGGTANTVGNYKWAIVIVPAGTTDSTIAMGAGGSMYDPEQMVLAFGSGCTYNIGDGAVIYEGSTKSMRKLKAGDKLIFTCFGTATERHDISGTVQFFYKT